MKKRTLVFLVTSFLALTGFLISTNDVNAATLYVGAGNFSTIQSAINAASAGDTINVASGTYKENLLITKPITIIGVGIDKPIISGSLSNTWNYGILIDHAGAMANPVEINNFDINNIWGNGASAISVEDNSYAVIDGNTITSFTKNGIRFVDSKGKVSNNTITGDTVDGINRSQNLINLRNGSDVEINNNTLSHALTDMPAPDKFDSIGIFINAYPNGVASNANIHDNDISSCDIAIDVSSKHEDTDYSSATISNNNIHDSRIGINFEKDSGSAVISGNTYNNVTTKTDKLAGNAVAFGGLEKTADASPKGALAIAAPSVTASVPLLAQASGATADGVSNVGFVFLAIILVMGVAGGIYRRYHK